MCKLELSIERGIFQEKAVTRDIYRLLGIRVVRSQMMMRRRKAAPHMDERHESRIRKQMVRIGAGCAL